MDQEQGSKIGHGRGFLAALDQSGGSTPKALALYGVAGVGYATEDEMFDLMHEMRTRIITSPSLQRRPHPRRDPVRADDGPRGRRAGHGRVPVGAQAASSRSSRSTRASPTRPTACS